ncbi:aldehyde dehydrogenase family protein [Salmonella enterica subsp. enterica]|nr:aldehyde dehydrogenase family protein [Salmonella enterica subsp. enterica]
MLADVDNRMRVAQEEIFGPVACLLPFKKTKRKGYARRTTMGPRSGLLYLDPGT